MYLRCVENAETYKWYINGLPLQGDVETDRQATFTGLVSGTQYLIGVMVCNAAGCSDGYSEWWTTAPANANLIFVKKSVASVTLKVVGVQGATAYRIYKDGTYIRDADAGIEFTISDLIQTLMNLVFGLYLF